MDYRKLGNTDIDVSLICLGTMTWGEQNTEAEAHAQLDLALEQGVNFIDTAEMYPVPPKETTQGLTETYIGTWLHARKNREDVVLATKVVGPSQRKWVRPGSSQMLDRANITEAIDQSLKRLQTDYIDLYQLHWPDRVTNCFGELGYRHDPDWQFTPIEETLSVLDDFVKAGKIRHIGLSNETPWGTMKFLRESETNHFPRVMSIQNPYSLLNRSYEVGMAEVSIREQCGLLAYSPLAFGLLTGKYLDGKGPEAGRINKYNAMSRYNNPQAQAATIEYATVAQKHGLSFTAMSLGFVNQQPFVTSNIIGATTLKQLQENIDSYNVTLTPDCMADIEAVHAVYTYPCP